MRSVRAWCLDAASKGVAIVVIARALQPRVNFAAQLMLCLERTLRLRSRHDVLMVLARADNALRHKLEALLRSIKDRLATLPRSARWAAGGACVGYVAAYVALARRPKLTSRKGVTQDILERCEFTRRRYWPHPITALNGACATLQLGSRMPYAGCGVLTAPYVERLQLDDGGTVALSWWRCPHQTSRTDVAVVFPGLNNSSETGFVRSLLSQLDGAGFLAVAYDYRGAGASGVLTSTKPYSADAWRDFDGVLEHIRQEVGPKTRLFLVGQSLGGAILAKYLSSRNPRVTAACTVSSPRSFAASSAQMRSGPLARLQNFAIAIPLKVSWFLSGRKSGRKRDVIFARSIYDIEAAVICKPWGHATPEAYYEANDGFADLGRLSCPLLCVQSVDDNVVPFSGKYAISDATLVNLSPFIGCCTTLLGGHLSFLDWRGRSWADRVVVEFFAAAAKRLPAAQASEEGSKRRTKMRRSPSWREAAPRASPPEKRPPQKPAAATPVSERRRALPSVKGVLAGM
jgi:predicted alpha/beta-fold hydrolase